MPAAKSLSEDGFHKLAVSSRPARQLSKSKLLKTYKKNQQTFEFLDVYSIIISFIKKVATLPWHIPFSFLRAQEYWDISWAVIKEN